MQLRSSFLTPLLLVTLSVLVPAAADRGHGHHPHPHPPRSRSGSSVFPFLTWIRDNAVRIVFGDHSSKETTHIIPADLGRRFKDEIIIRFNVSTAEEEQALAEATERLFLDIWSWDGTVDLRVQKNHVKPLLSLLPPSLDSYWVLVDDLPSAIYDSYPSPPTPKEHTQFDRKVSVDLTNSPNGDEGLYFFRSYQPPKVVLRWMRLIEAMFPSFVRFTTIGQSYEGRDIPALVVSAGGAGPRDSTKRRKTLVVMGGSHAREWISTTTVNYLAWSFITSYGKDPLTTKFMQTFDIVFIPELNPDGIEYTWSVDRLWRKSRQHTSMQFCRGLDLDHAFGYEWDGSRTGHLNDPCSESYAGDEPWESVEVSAFRDWAKEEVETNNVEFVGLIDLHSYSQQILFPYSYSCDIEPPNIEKMEELALGLAKSIRLFSGETYSVKPACQGAVPETKYGPAKNLRIESGGGSAIDWFYHELGAHYSYQIKLRDMGSYGFLLPSNYIIPTGEEILQSMRYLGDFLLGNDGIESTRSDEGSESDQELFAVSEEYEDVVELKKRRRR